MNIHDAEAFEARLANAPKSTQSKIRELIDASASAHAAAAVQTERLRDANASLREARGNFASRFRGIEETMTANGPVFDFQETSRGPTAEEVGRYTSRIERAWADVQRYSKTLAKAQDAWEGHSFLSDVSDWLANGGRATKAHKMPVPSLPKGKTFADLVSTIRDEIGAIDDKISSLKTAPAPIDDLISRMDAAIDHEAARYSSTCYANSRDRAPFNIAGVGFEMIGGIVFWALSEEIKTALAAKIRAAHPGDAIGDFERAAELSALAAEKLVLERHEEAAIVAASDIGQIIPRRRDADPRAILEVE